MKDALTQKSAGYMPREAAVMFLTSKYSKTNPFRKRCFRAMERVCEPVSRSTALNVSAPKTGAQRLQARLSKASVKQLATWHRRTLRRGERLHDARDSVADEKLVELLDKQIDRYDALCEAIHNELTSRSTRGKGYRKPIKRSKV